MRENGKKKSVFSGGRGMATLASSRRRREYMKWTWGIQMGKQFCFSVVGPRNGLWCATQGIHKKWADLYAVWMAAGASYSGLPGRLPPVNFHSAAPHHSRAHCEGLVMIEGFIRETESARLWARKLSHQNLSTVSPPPLWLEVKLNRETVGSGKYIPEDLC